MVASGNRGGKDFCGSFSVSRHRRTTSGRGGEGAEGGGCDEVVERFACEEEVEGIGGGVVDEDGSVVFAIRRRRV
jgi:hypothetical protein